jgi:hypothetical protein
MIKESFIAKLNNKATFFPSISERAHVQEVTASTINLQTLHHEYHHDLPLPARRKSLMYLSPVQMKWMFGA